MEKKSLDLDALREREELEKDSVKQLRANLRRDVEMSIPTRLARNVNDLAYGEGIAEVFSKATLLLSAMTEGKVAETEYRTYVTNYLFESLTQEMSLRPARAKEAHDYYIEGMRAGIAEILGFSSLPYHPQF